MTDPIPLLLAALVGVEAVKLAWTIYRDLRETDYLTRLSLRGTKRG